MSRNELLLKNQLCLPLYSASNALQRLYKPLLAPLEITYPQYLILMALWEKDGMNIQTICEATYFDSGTITPLLQKLKAKSLIDIKTLESDRRSKLIFLTKKGANLEQKASKVPKSLLCLLSKQGSEFATLKLHLEKLHQTILKAEEKESI